MRVPPEAVSLGRRCAKPPSAVAAGVSRRATPVVAIGRAKVPERRLGSSASRIPSPSRLTDITISRITGYHRHDEEHDHRDPQQSRNGKKQSRQNIPAHLRSPRFILAQIDMLRAVGLLLGQWHGIQIMLRSENSAFRCDFSLICILPSTHRKRAAGKHCHAKITC